MIGRTLSHYRIVGQLGAGGMGEVYLAEDVRLERPVAIKVLPADVTKDASRLRRFEQEARAASALNHPNIVTIHEIGDADAGRFIVLEYVKGQTLRSIIEGAQSFQSIAPIGRQVGRALAVAHEAGIIHRDIKPENIMVREDGYVKVLDFGLARLSTGEASTESSAQTAVRTRPGMLVGTLAYMSPEQVRSEPVEGASDIFSLGVIFYEMATGQKPFKADSEVALMHAIGYDQPEPPSHLNPALQPSLEMLILTMLDKNPHLRPNAEEVAAALSAEEQTISLTSNVLARPSVVPAIARNTVGREKERERLRAAYQSANEGRGLMLCITGEAGLGKTTLVEDFLKELQQAHPACQVGRGRSSERLAGAEAYLPFLEALEGLMRRPSGQHLVRAMKVIAPSWYLQLATSQEASVERVRAEASPVSQERMKRELANLLEEVSGRSPLVLFFDDLQWADASTIDIIAYIATRLATMHLLMVATYRSAEMKVSKHPFLPVMLDMQGRGLCQELALEFLTRDDVERYLAIEFPNHRFPKQFGALIYTKTEGSPLFIAEVIHYLRDRRVIGEADGHWSLVQTVPEIENDLPETVRSMIQRKIAQLGDADRRLLVAASAQGYNFDSAVLARALAVDPGDVEERLQSLDQTHGFVKYRKEDEFPDHTLTLKYTFVHVLYQNALYATLTPSRRASLSASIAEALLEFYGRQSPSVASELAFLFQAARDWWRASDYFLKAARNAARIFANREAIALCQRGLEITRRLPDSTEKAQQELKLQITMGPSLMTVKGFAATDTLKTYLRARELCEQVNDNAQLFRVLFGLSIVSVVRAEYEKGREYAEESLKLAELSEDAALLVQAHWLLALSIQYQGEFIRSRQHLERSIALYDPQRHAAHVFLYGAILNRAHLGRVLLYLGYPEQAQALMQEALRIAEKIRHPVGLCNALSVAVTMEAFHRNAEKIIAMADQMLFQADEHGLPYYAGIATIMRGSARAMRGEVEAGCAEVRNGLTAHRNVETEQQRATYLILMAEALGKAGQMEAGLQALEEASKTISDTGEHCYEAELYRVKGELLLNCASRTPDDLATDLNVSVKAPPEIHNAQQQAEECYKRAIDISRKQSARGFELRAAIGLARLWQEQGKLKEARELLSPIYDSFTEGFEMPDLIEARRLLSGLN